ncbi:hypothetical protein [uncultured Ruminococcus sp.]|uniref:hypothetical protein n=1 Tax=uncultured Ruminococcus sp. TaxID=165186 RepID=UPI0029310257|nr:hypothetical protein [uncultured Ruminococcus sp.]
MKNGYAFFFHCFGDRKPYTGGCVSVPENTMKIIMQSIKPGCMICRCRFYFSSLLTNLLPVYRIESE